MRILPKTKKEELSTTESGTRPYREFSLNQVTKRFYKHSFYTATFEMGNALSGQLATKK
jgi:hypothetical protein